MAILRFNEILVFYIYESMTSYDIYARLGVFVITFVLLLCLRTPPVACEVEALLAQKLQHLAVERLMQEGTCTSVSFSIVL